MAQNNHNNIIKTIYNELKRRIKGKDWNDDISILKLFQIYYDTIYDQIHNVLVPLGTKNSENEIRDIIAKYIIGYSNQKTKEKYIGALEFIETKVALYDKMFSKPKNFSGAKFDELKEKMEIKARYEDLKDNFLALASFRSFKHFCLYMQSAMGSAFTLWSDTQEIFEGYFFYAGRMVLDGNVKFLEKQCPTGFGKTASDAFLHAWIFGINIDYDVFKVCGNDNFTADCFQIVVNLMLSPQYAKVFPYYEQFKCKKDNMFSFCGKTELKFSITGSKKTNLRIVTKLTNTNGVRARFLFLDDITQRRDMASNERHEADIHSFNHEWFERNYNRNIFSVVASGTTYSQFDILSYLKRVMGGDNTKKTIYRYTRIGYSDFIVPKGLSVFVCIPLLDYVTDESTYPEKISTESARKKREESPAEFWAMDMQQPLPPDNSPFYFKKLRQYSSLPNINENGRGETCVAALDTKRRGTDFLSMPILFEADDVERKSGSVFYLKDWLYDDRTMEECIPLIVAKIIQHKITRLYVERNTEECIEMILREKLEEQNYTNCIIEEVYSTEPKDRRIMSAEGAIKSKIIFPEYNMYSPSNDIGKALFNLYGYTYKGKVAHDDAPDSIALFAKKYIINSQPKYAEIQIFGR
jgi:hypothetical protein